MSFWFGILNEFVCCSSVLELSVCCSVSLLRSFKPLFWADDAFRGGGGEFSGLPPVELSTLPQLVKVGFWLCPPGA